MAAAFVVRRANSLMAAHGVLQGDQGGVGMHGRRMFGGSGGGSGRMELSLNLEDRMRYVYDSTGGTTGFVPALYLNRLLAVSAAPLSLV